MQGVKAVEATNERDGDSFAFRIESERGIDVRKSVFNLCAKMSWPIIGMMPIGTDLESIFIRLVDRSDGVEPAQSQKRKRAH